MNHMYNKLKNHIGHSIVCVAYGDEKNPADICIECEDCCEVLVSAEDYVQTEYAYAYNGNKAAYITSNKFEEYLEGYIADIDAKRKEILDAGKDTFDDTPTWNRENIIADILFTDLVDEDGEYYNGYPVTDNRDTDVPFNCRVEYDDDNDITYILHWSE